jgi:hypothetical protein
MAKYSGLWTLSQQAQAFGQNLWPKKPGAPTIGTATSGNTQATVAFTAPTDLGVPAVITAYTATSSPGSITGTASSSPITVTGLSNGTAYTFTVTATNATGTGPASAASNSVTPTAPVTLEYKYGSCPGGTSMTGLTYSGLSNGPTAMSLGVTSSFTGTSGDRCVVIDLSQTFTNSNTTATQNGSNYFSVWTSTDGSNWTERVAYSSVGSGSSYTYSLSGASHRYVAYTSGEGGSIFTSIKVNSYS